ncbi:cytochrome P450 [Sorangium sp. So ce362]|uniref:cytochrome P450 n=1 Tax=Sorangium sp. So ce362 TaxID=3133303 RepID=UPI003F5EDD35
MMDSGDPYEIYRLMRDEGGAIELSEGAWVVTRYHEVVATLSDDALCQPTAGPAEDEVESLAGLDPPEHTRQRRLVQEAWSARRTHRVYGPIVRDVIAALVDELRPAGHADLIARFASPMADRVLGAVLGIPGADLGQVLAWVEIDARSLGGILDDRDQALVDDARRSLRDYLTGLVAARRAAPTDDAISEMAAARAPGHEPMTDAELVSLLQQILVAGTETVKNAIGIAVHCVLQTPGLAQELRDRPALIAGAFEEALRYDAPVQCLARRARRDVRVGDAEIPAESSLLLLYGSANRDPRRFADPDRFDPARPDAASHLSLGYGIHFCLGAPLARLEARVALEALFTRLPNLRHAGPAPVTWLPHPLWRRMGSLHVAWDD